MLAWAGRAQSTVSEFPLAHSFAPDKGVDQACLRSRFIHQVR